MADIASNRVKLNDIEISANAPLTEALFNKMGANINDYLDKGLRYEEFLSNDTWTCPLDVEWISALGCGGGAGGRSAINPGGNIIGGNGGNGAPIINQLIKVTPGNVYTITIGSGGAANLAGGDTTFIGADASIYFRGAIATVSPSGVYLEVGSIGVGAGPVVLNKVMDNTAFLNSALGGCAVSGSPAGNGQSTQFASGGIGFNSPSNFNGGGGGAGFGAGGNGGAEVASPTAAAANSGAGGGGGGSNGLLLQTGAAGGSGRLRLYWYGNS